MRGEVIEFEEGAGGGTILGEDGETYHFNASSIRSKARLSAGERVDFVALEKVATHIYGLGVEPGARASIQPARSAHGAFDVGRVIQRTFDAIRHNAVTFLVAAVLLVGLPSLVMVYGQSVVLLSQNFTGLALAALGWLLYLIGIYVLQGLVIKVTVARFNGKTMSIGEGFEAGVKVFFPLIGVAIVVGLGLILGFMVLIVPGIILAVIWSVATGAVVVEGRGVGDALQRSRDLTRGYRWQIFGLGVIMVIASMIIGMAVGGISAATGGGFIAGSASLAINMVTSAVSNILNAVIGAAGVGALYYELRSVKEGVGPEQLASVFD
jgi:hypothetical protein